MFCIPGVRDANEKIICRHGIAADRVKALLLNANEAGSFHESHPSLLRFIQADQTRVLLLISSLAPGVLNDSEVSVLSAIASVYPSISGSRFVPPLVRELLRTFTSAEAFSIVSCVAERTKGSRPYLSRSKDFREWSVFQLTRFLKSPSDSQVALIDDFVLSGGSAVLTDDAFSRLVGCFLYEGCKVFVRIGIAWLLLSDAERMNTDLLFRKAFSLRISLNTFPLSESRRGKIKRFELIPNIAIDPVIPWLPVSSELTDLAHEITVALEKLVVPIQTIEGLEMKCIHKSETDGFSPTVFINRMESLADSVLRVLVVRVSDGCVTMLAIGGRVTVHNSGRQDRMGIFDSRPDGPSCLQIGDSVVLMDQASQPILCTDTAITLISVPSFGQWCCDMKILNYEIFEFFRYFFRILFVQNIFSG